jgi:hypothetical protein
LPDEVGKGYMAGLPAVASEASVGGSNSVVESQPSKLLVAGSIPVSRSILRLLRELRLANPEVRRLSAIARRAKAETSARQAM